MRFLYGDSAPCPLNYNFLSTLEAFISSATTAVELEAQARLIYMAASEAANNRLKNIDGLERFHQVVMRALRDTSSRSVEGLMIDYARQLAEHASRIVEGARAVATQGNDRELASARQESERRRGEIRATMEAFFKAGRLPIIDSRISMRLADGRDPQNEMSAVLTFPEGIVVGYTLLLDAAPEWKQPRKVSDFAQGMDLMVGARKSMFTKTVQPEMVHLDDYTIGGFQLSQDDAEIRLRKRADRPDSLVFSIKRLEDSLIAEVHHPDDAEAEGQLSSHVEAGDRPQLERLWQLLRSGSAGALEHKARVVSIHLDGNEVFSTDKVIPLVQRIVKIMAPTVQEIARRSPNKSELSLKVENLGGRREEIYVKKDDLLAKLSSLPAEQRAIFQPLGLGVEPSVIVPE